MADLGAEILQVLKSRGPVKAREILGLLPAETARTSTRTEVNALLYGVLRHRVFKDSEDRWHISPIDQGEIVEVEHNETAGSNDGKSPERVVVETVQTERAAGAGDASPTAEAEEFAAAETSSTVSDDLWDILRQPEMKQILEAAGLRTMEEVQGSLQDGSLEALLGRSEPPPGDARRHSNVEPFRLSVPEPSKDSEGGWERTLGLAYQMLLGRRLRQAARALLLESGGPDVEPPPVWRDALALLDGFSERKIEIVRERVIPTRAARGSQAEIARRHQVTPSRISQMEDRIRRDLDEQIRRRLAGLEVVLPEARERKTPLADFLIQVEAPISLLRDRDSGDLRWLAFVLVLRHHGLEVVGDYVVQSNAVGRATGLRDAGPVDPRDAIARLVEILSGLEDRELQLLEIRTLSEAPKTLEEVGGLFGVTRERVRQLEKKCLAKIDDECVQALGDFDPLGGATTLSRPSFENKFAPDVGTLAEQRLVDLALKWIRKKHALESRGQFVAREATWSALDAQVAKLKQTRRTPLASVLRRIGDVIPEIDREFLIDMLLDSGLRVTASGTVEVPVRGTGPKVSAAFDDAGRPMGAQEICELTGLTRAQVRGVLQRKESFSWVGNGVYAPVDWGLPVYNGTENALVDAVRARGGTARIAEVIDEVVTKFGCTPQSCQTYIAGSPRLSRDRDHVSLADETPRPAAEGNPKRQARVYSDCEGGIVWAVDVTSDLLRGTGHYMPGAVASRFGLHTFSEDRFEAPGGAIRLYWNTQLPQISSLRPLAEALDARLGDRLLLRMPKAGAHFWDLCRHAAASQAPELLVGRHDPATSSLASIAAACWDVDVDLLEEFLWDRKERVLLEALQLPKADPRGRAIDVKAVDLLISESRLSRRSLARQAGLPETRLYGIPGADGLVSVTSVESTLVVRELASVLSLPQKEVTELIFPRLGDYAAEAAADLDDLDLLF